jgi:hypothetical protein
MSEQRWMIFFEDQDVRPEIFTDEAAARARHQQCLLSGAHGQYLRNRLMRAFQAGWDAHEEHTGPKRSGRAGVPEDDGLEMSGDVQRWRPSKGDINKIKMEVSPTGKYVRYADFLAAHHRAVQPPSAWPFRKSP